MKLTTFIKISVKKIKEKLSGKNEFLQMLKDMDFDDDDIKNMGYEKLLDGRGKTPAE